VVRNNSVVKLMLRLPIDTRDANLREWIWQSLVTANATDKLYGSPANSVERDWVFPVRGIDAGDRWNWEQAVGSLSPSSMRAMECS
jgi:hypothetical protein